MKRTAIIAAVVGFLGFGLGGLAGASMFFGWPMAGHGNAVMTPSHPKFSEVQWPYPTDELGQGQSLSL